MKKRWLIGGLTIGVMLLTLTGCVPGDGSYAFDKPAGFLSGVWHGWIAPFSLIAGIFMDGIRVYEVFNTGWWYDFGFYIAVISGFGGLSLSRKKKKEGK
ncbi:MAG: hypothetical protein AB7E31_12480 [Desulfitobacterium sp.]